MPVHLGVTRAFRSAGAAERDAVGELRFDKLAMPGLVGARHDAAGGVADRGAIEIEPDAGHQVGNLSFGQTRIRASGAGLDAAEARVDAAAHRLGVSGPFGMRAEHRAHGNRGHGTFSWRFLFPASRRETPSYSFGSECDGSACREFRPSPA